MVNGLAAANVRVFPCEGTYFLQVDARSFGYHDGTALCGALPGLAGVAGVVFFDSTEVGRPLVRFAFCKGNAVIKSAVAKSAQLATQASLTTMSIGRQR